MSEFFNSIWEWVVSNKDAIMTFFTSTNFLATISAIAALIKTISTTKSNTLSVNSVNATMQENTVMKQDVENVKTELSVTKKEIEETKAIVVNCTDKLDKVDAVLKQYSDELIAKQNAMLEVQSIVYATIKDDNIRNSVNNILVSAKHSDTASKIKLQEELEALRSQLKAKNAELDEAVNKVVEKVSVDVVSVPSNESNITRY